MYGHGEAKRCCRLSAVGVRLQDPLFQASSLQPVRPERSKTVVSDRASKCKSDLDRHRHSAGAHLDVGVRLELWGLLMKYELKQVGKSVVEADALMEE